MCIFGLRSYCFFLKYTKKSGKNIEKYSYSASSVAFPTYGLYFM